MPWGRVEEDTHIRVPVDKKRLRNSPPFMAPQVFNMSEVSNNLINL